MIRMILFGLLIFLLPLIVALFWIAVIKKLKPSDADLKVWAIAGSAGLILLLGSLFWLRTSIGVSTNYQYVPAEIRDGELIRGYFDPVNELSGEPKK